ncbi:MAG: SDR family oxidoreductase, partial [bacterium]|nr:SDR family oxidoreductase [bacterium]
ALITGASRGIGRHLALGLARAGFDLAIIATDEARLEAVRAEVAELAPAARVVAQAVDVTDAAAVAAAARTAERELGGIDLLVNNAGRIDSEVALWEADPEEWWEVMAVNVRGPFLLARAVLPGMIARGGGRIVNVNSGSGTRDFEESSAYTASKSALFRIGGAIHLAAFDRGIRTFELAPGVVRTDMTEGMRLHDGREEWTEPEDVVALVLMLASGGADHLSGSYVRVGNDDPADLRGRRTARRLGLVDDPLDGTFG